MKNIIPFFKGIIREGYGATILQRILESGTVSKFCFRELCLSWDEGPCQSFDWDPEAVDVSGADKRTCRLSHSDQHTPDADLVSYTSHYGENCEGNC